MDWGVCFATDLMRFRGLVARVHELVQRMRILDGLDLPTRHPDSLPDGAPGDHFGHLQSTDA